MFGKQVLSRCSIAAPAIFRGVRAYARGARSLPEGRRRAPRERSDCAGSGVRSRPLPAEPHAGGPRAQIPRSRVATWGTLRAMTEKFSVGLVQMSCSANPAENLEKAVAKVAEAARAGARIVCLPELFRSRYFCQREDPAIFDLAEPVPGPTTEALARAARDNGVAVVAPVFERRAPGP